MPLKYSQEIKEKAKKLYKNKIGPKEISKLLGVSRSTIGYWIKDLPKHRRQNVDSHKMLLLSCPQCLENFKRRKSQVDLRKEKGRKVLCKICTRKEAGKIRWENLSELKKNHIALAVGKGSKKYCASLTLKERTERSRKAGKHNTDWAPIQQWKSIKSDPEKLKKLKAQRSKTSKKIWDNYTLEERTSRIAIMLKQNKASKEASLFLDCLNESGIKLQREVPISGFVVDALHEETKTIIEYYGDFWHCNPKTYTNPDQYCNWLSRSVKEQWERDRRRLGALYGKGYKVIVIWGSDWNEDKENQLSCILHKIETNKNDRIQRVTEKT